MLKKIIKSKFSIITIWPFNPKAMDEKTKLSDFYTSTIITHILDVNNNNFDGTIDDTNQWHEDEVAIQSLNIITTIKNVGIWVDVNV